MKKRPKGQLNANTFFWKFVQSYQLFRVVFKDYSNQIKKKTFTKLRGKSDSFEKKCLELLYKNILFKNFSH